MPRYVKFIPIFFMFLFFSMILYAQPEQLGSENTQFYRDTSSSMDIRGIIDLPENAWVSPDKNLYFGYSEDVVWLRFPVESDESEQFFLTEHHGIDRFDVWITSDIHSNPVFLGTGGWSVSGRQWDPRVIQSFSTVPVRLKKDNRSILYIRVQSTSSLSLNFILFDMNDYQRTFRATEIMQGIGLGSSMIMTVFALIIMVSLWRREFVYFFLLVLMAALLGFYIGGFGPLTLWKNHPDLTLFIGLSSVPLLLIVIVRFFRSILDLDRFPIYRKWLISSEILMYLVLLIVNTVPRTLGFQISSFVTLVMILYLQTQLLVGVLLHLQYSKYLLIAWSMTLIAGLYQMMVNLGFLPYIPNVYNPGFIIMFAFLVQNAILGGTIVVQSEMSIVDERLRRTDAEHQVKDARERLIQTDRMSGLASMVSSVSHEIATPVGNARLLGSEIESRSRSLGDYFNRGELSKEEFEDFLGFTVDSGALIVQTLSHAGSIMEGFKVVAADKATLKQKSIEPQEYFKRLERVLLPGIRKSGYELTVLIEAEKSIQTIPGYVTQVMDNLVNNAVRHAFPKGVKGHIKIEVRNTQRDNKLEIIVSDDGRGIPEDVLPHIFEMFYTTRDGEGGTGLGLAISKTLAEEHLRGYLKCFTEKDKGTSFVFGIADLSEDPGIT